MLPVDISSDSLYMPGALLGLPLSSHPRPSSPSAYGYIAVICYVPRSWSRA